MKIPFMNRKADRNTVLETDLLDIMKLDNNMSSDMLFRTIRHTINYFKIAQATKIWTSQIMVELLYQVFNHTQFDDMTKNRYILMIFQELSRIQKSRQSEELLIVSGISFKNFMLQNLKLKGIYFVGCEFDDADLSASSFRNCEFRGCSFNNSDLSKTKFIKVKTIGCNFIDAIMEGSRGL